MKKNTVPDLLALKGVRKVINTAVMDASMAQVIDETRSDMTGAGATVAAMVVHGHHSPIPATLDQILIYLRPIARTLKKLLLATTLPYGTYQASNEDTVSTAIQLMQAGADSVKLEGTGRMLDRLSAITSVGIPCMGHVGMAPQQIHLTGGYRSVGRTAAEALKVYNDAMSLEAAGAWMIELECVPWKVAEKITQDLKVLTMGTGSGTGCDGQGLMTQDLWGLQMPVKPRLAKQYADLHTTSVNALRRYKEELNDGRFPPPSMVDDISNDEFNRFMDRVG